MLLGLLCVLNIKRKMNPHQHMVRDMYNKGEDGTSRKVTPPVSAVVCAEHRDCASIATLAVRDAP